MAELYVALPSASRTAQYTLVVVAKYNFTLFFFVLFYRRNNSTNAEINDRTSKTIRQRSRISFVYSSYIHVAFRSINVRAFYFYVGIHREKRIQKQSELRVAAHPTHY